jgi:hypothetical protein
MSSSHLNHHVTMPSSINQKTAAKKALPNKAER